MAKYTDKNKEMRFRLNLLAEEFLKMKESLAKIDKEMRRLRSAAGLQADEMLFACEKVDWQEFVRRLNTRAANVLEENGIVDAASLASLTVERLCEFRNCGARTQLRITNVLHEFGIDLPHE